MLGEEEINFEQGTQAVLQEYQSFTDLVNSKDKCISCIDWHPQHKGIVAVSCTLAASFDERIQRRLSNRNDCIIVWSFNDPIHPQATNS
jgi:hypothetical protein